MKIAIAGKGGSGKTTTAGTLARVFARQGYKVLAIDGDSNPNLGITLGIPADELNSLEALPRDLLTDIEDEDGQRHSVLRSSVEEIAAAYGTTAADGVQLLAMKKINHAGDG